jgi:hypothetical protein
VRDTRLRELLLETWPGVWSLRISLQLWRQKPLTSWYGIENESRYRTPANVRISPRVYGLLRQLAEESMQAILDKALEQYRYRKPREAKYGT